MHTRVFRHGRLLVFAALFTVFAQGRAGAAPLNLTSTTPDITAFFLDFTFDSSGNVCGAGSVYTLGYCSASAAISSYGLTPEIMDSVPYELVAAVDPLTGLLTGGGLFSIGNLGSEYLTGTVSAFGSTVAGGVAVLEFIIDITGGSLAPAFGPTLGVIGSVWNWGYTDFGAELTFISSTDEYTDNFPIPEPASLCLLGLGLFGLSAARRLRRS